MLAASAGRRRLINVANESLIDLKLGRSIGGSWTSERYLGDGRLHSLAFGIDLAVRHAGDDGLAFLKRQ